jgi:hypothetical protein
MDNTDQHLADLMQRIDRMNAEQRRIIGGVVAMLRTFDDTGAARRWLNQHQQSILVELRRASREMGLPKG